MTATTIEAIEHLSFEYELSCETRSNPCKPRNPADYMVVLGCCGHSFLMCQDCLDKRLDREASGFVMWACRECGRSGMFLSEAFARLERI